MNRDKIEFDQSVYVLTDVLVNASVGSSLLHFVATYKGQLRSWRQSKTTSFTMAFSGSAKPRQGLMGHVDSHVKYNISCTEAAFGIEYLYSVGSKAFYSLVLKRPMQYFVNPQHRYQFKIEAYSPNEPSLYSRAWIQISLRNFNCHNPIFISEQSFSVSEIAEQGHIVGVVQAYDPDGDRVSYKFKHASDQYKIDETSGVIVVLRRLILTDKHTKFHQLQVVAEDDASSCPSGLDCGKRYNETTVMVKISDVNIYSPSFKTAICGQTIEIPEHMNVDRPITTLSAVDQDRGDNGRLEFFFPDASSSKNNAYQKFRLSPHQQMGSVRNVSIYATESFDYDAPQAIHTFFLLIFAQDSGQQRRQGFCFLKISIVDKNDNRPIFVMNHWEYQLRNTSHLISKGQRLFRIIASDKDSGENGRVRYFMNSRDNKYFEIEQDSGFVKFKDSDIVFNLNGGDFPQKFEVSARDSATPSKWSSTNASVVIKLSGSMDAELEWGEEFFNDFTVNVSEKFHSKFGLANIRDEVFDGNITFIGYGHISNPRFHLSPRPEDSLFVASKTRLLGPLSDVSGANKFAAGIRLTNELDAEVKDVHYLYLRVEDLQGLQNLVGLCKVFVRDENDQIPFFDSSELRISLLEGNWTEEVGIGRVQAFDQDRNYPNNYVRYRLRPGENDEIRQMFSVHETGEIVAHGYFDREARSSWNFYVESYDGANGYGLNEPNTDSVAVRVEIIDVNDNRPQFTEESIQITISELFEKGRSIIQLACDDPDYDSHLQFHIVDGNELGHFKIRRNPALGSSQTRHTADLYVIGNLDYTMTRNYRLRILASDSLNFDEIMVDISLTAADCRAPVFIGQSTYHAHIAENIAAHDFVTLMARAHDVTDTHIGGADGFHGSRSFLSVAGEDSDGVEMTIVDPDLYPDFQLSGHRLSIVRGLDRDPPNGRPFWILPIQGDLFPMCVFLNISLAMDKRDNNVEAIGSRRTMSQKGSENPIPRLVTFANVNITVEDVNDNGPFIVDDEMPFVLMEKQRSPSFRFRLDDVDNWSAGHGGPFKEPVVVASTLGAPRDYSISLVSGPGDKPTYNLTFNGGQLDREKHPSNKHFQITIYVKDASGLGGRVNLPVVIGDKNDNPHQDGEKIIYVHRYLLWVNLDHIRTLHAGYIGNVFVEDLDDWDITEKAFTNLPENQFFDVDSLGRISVNEKAARYIEQGDYEFKVDVFDRMFGTSVTGIVDVVLRDISEKDVRNAVHLRLAGINSQGFVERRRSANGPSIMDLLSGNLTALLGVKPSSVIIMNVRDYRENEIDVYFVVRGFSRPLVEQKIRQTTYLHQLFKIRSISPNPCYVDIETNKSLSKCPTNMVCLPLRIVGATAFDLVDTNRSSLAGLRIADVADCVCSDYFGNANANGQQRLSCTSSGGYCRNGGRCKREESPAVRGLKEFFCECPFGFEGPRCEALERNFQKNGFAKFRALAYCQPNRLHLEFSSLSEAKAGLLLLNGDPFTDVETDKYFMAIQIVNASLVVHLGANSVVRLGNDLVDGNWHHVDIEQVGKIAKVTMDQCESKVIYVSEESRNKARESERSTGAFSEAAFHFRDNNHDEALYLGGLPQHLRVQDVFRHVLAVHEYEGCIRNVMIDGQHLDLFIPKNLEGSQYKDSSASPCPCHHHMYCDISMLPRMLVPSIPWWIWLLILAIIFITTTSLAVTLVGFMRRRNDMFLKRCYSNMNAKNVDALDTDDSGYRENLISYEDCAGEQDQTCFDMSVLMKPLIESKALSRSPQMRGFSNERMNDQLSSSAVNRDQSDSLIVWAYEGNESEMPDERCNLSTISCDSHKDVLEHSAMQGCRHRDTLTRLAALFERDDADTSSSETSRACSNAKCDPAVNWQHLTYSDDDSNQPLLLPVELPTCEHNSQYLLSTRDKQHYSEHSKRVSCEESRLIQRQNGWNGSHSPAPNGGRRPHSPKRFESDI